MSTNEIIEFLESRLAKYKEDEPYAHNTFAAYEYVINDLLNEDQS